MYLSAALVGACLGFLPYNFRPGRAVIFLGDSGATFIGFTLAGLAVLGDWAARLSSRCSRRRSFWACRFSTSPLSGSGAS
jgi:UDP-N-acetylmuramyl pentapeptide phosphotransferase/UDP-N-acetylglucosamine-1-phosphate transferase